jgi:hypothetical protein
MLLAVRVPPQLFWLVAVAGMSVVVHRAATAPSPPPLHVATPQERIVLAQRIAIREQEWRNKAAEDFPADDWSQRDAFHNLESDGVRDVAHQQGVYLEDVFRAVDEDLHKTRPGAARGTDVVPCRPRPVFD